MTTFKEYLAESGPMDLSHGSGKELKDSPEYKRERRRQKQVDATRKELAKRVSAGYQHYSDKDAWGNLKESAEFPGNYVAIDVDLDESLGMDAADWVGPSTGIQVPVEKRHVTLMYSKDSDIDAVELLGLINNEFPSKIIANGVSYEAFDSVPKDGERDDNKATLVLKLKSVVLDMLHARLKSFGMQHSYPEYSAHISLYYEVDRNECHALVDELNNTKTPPKSIVLSGYTSNPINDNWVDSIK